MIKAVMFDFGGVLSRFGLAGDTSKRVAKVLGCDVPTVDRKLGALIRRWIKAEVTTDEFWDQCAELAGLPVADYDARWVATETRDYEHLYYDFARKLRTEGYITGIFSNINETSENIIRNYGGYRDFSPVILSTETHTAKPEPAFYREVLM